MLLNDLYTIDRLQTGEDIIRANLRLDPAHPIFTSHFPLRPILPGACQLQMIRELLSHATATDWRLQQAISIKFLTMIDPREQGIIDLTLRYLPHIDGAQQLQVSAALTARETLCLKFNGIFAAG